MQRLISCPQLEQNYLVIFNSNNCLDHVLWVIQTLGGYHKKSDFFAPKAPQPESARLYGIWKTHFLIKVLTTMIMFLLPIIIGLSIDGLWTLIEHIFSAFDDTLSPGDQTPANLITDAAELVVKAASNMTLEALEGASVRLE